MFSGLCVWQTNDSHNVHTLALGTCDYLYITQHIKDGFPDMVKIFEKGRDYHGLSRCNHMRLYKKKPQKYLVTEEKRPYDRI